MATEVIGQINHDLSRLISIGITGSSTAIIDAKTKDHTSCVASKKLIGYDIVVCQGRRASNPGSTDPV